MSKQIDKQTNNKRFVLKKGQIAILEALYGGVGLEGVGVVGWVRVLPNRFSQLTRNIQSKAQVSHRVLE